MRGSGKPWIGSEPNVSVWDSQPELDGLRISSIESLKLTFSVQHLPHRQCAIKYKVYLACVASKDMRALDDRTREWL